MIRGVGLLRKAGWRFTECGGGRGEEERVTAVWDRAQAAFVGKFPNNAFWGKSGTD